MHLTAAGAARQHMHAGAGHLLHHPQSTFLRQFVVVTAEKVMHGSRHDLRVGYPVMHHLTRAEVMSDSMM